MFGLAPAMARASTTGALFQDPGPAGCIRDFGGGGCTAGRGLGEASQVVASPDGRNLYVASPGQNDEGSIAVFARDLTTGAATQLSGSAGCVAEDGTSDTSTCTVGIGLLGARGVAVSPDGKFVYTVGDNYSPSAGNTLAAIAIFSRDPGTGALTQLPGTAGCLSTTDEFGDARCATTSGDLGDLRDIVISSDGKFAYVVSPDTPLDDGGQLRVFSRDLATGELTDAGCVKETPGETECALGRAMYEPNALALSPDGHQLYVAASEGVNYQQGDDNGAVVTFDRDAATGALTQPADAAGCANAPGDDGTGSDTCALAKGLHDANDITVSPDGKNVYLANQGEYYNGGPTLGTLSVFTRDTSTGTLTQLAGTAGCVSQDTSDGYTGTLGVCAKGRGLIEVTGVTVSPDNSSVYVASSDSPGGAISVFSRDTSTGEVTQLDGAAGCLSPGGQDGDGGTTCTNANGLDGASALIALANPARPGCAHVYGASQDDDALFVLGRQAACAAAAIAAPKVTTGPASRVTSSGVQVNGNVDPSKASTTYTFEYGTSTAYGLQSAAGSLAAGDGEKAVSAGIDGLQPGRVYHYRLVATNSGGTAQGQDATFTTPRALTSRPGASKVTMSVKRKVRRGLPRYYIVTGRVVLPAGVPASAGCAGRVSVRIKTGKHSVSTRLVKLGKDCRYRASMHPNVHKRSHMTVSARFMGNAAFRPMSAKSRSIRA